MSKQEKIEQFVEQLFKEISVRVREIMREEMEIEGRRLRRKILKEVQTMLLENKPAQIQQSRTHLPHLLPQTKSVSIVKNNKKLDVGDPVINEILENTHLEIDDPLAYTGQSESLIPNQSVSFNEAVQKKTVQETQKAGQLWKPEEGEAYNFDPLTMDPAKIDWSNMVEALEGVQADPSRVQSVMMGE